MEIFDIPFSILSIIGGIAFLCIRKQQAAARLERVKKGELTETVAKKRNRELTMCGYTMIALGIGIAVSHFLSK